VSSSRTFEHVDHVIFHALWRCARRRHPRNNLEAGSNGDTLTGASSGKHATVMGSRLRSGCSAPVAHPSNDTLRSKAKPTRMIRPGRPISSNAKGPTCWNRFGVAVCSALSGIHNAVSARFVMRKSLNVWAGACITASPAHWVARPAQRIGSCFIKSATATVHAQGLTVSKPRFLGSVRRA
jgi:hypothetical protein